MDNTKLIYGFHTIHLHLEHHPETIQKLWIKVDRQDKRIQQLIDLAKNHPIEIERAPSVALDTLTHHAHHQGVAARVTKQYLPLTVEEVLDACQPPFSLLILDGVTDPHNLGACLRVADAMGAQAVIAPKDRSAKITPVVAKVACGAAESVPYILVTNLARTLQSLQKVGIHVVGLETEGALSLFHCEAASSIAWVLGAEDKGLRHLTKRYCDTLVHLPMLGIVESLNVSVCAGIVLAETQRQRTHLGSPSTALT